MGNIKKNVMSLASSNLVQLQRNSVKSFIQCIEISNKEEKKEE